MMSLPFRVSSMGALMDPGQSSHGFTSRKLASLAAVNCRDPGDRWASIKRGGATAVSSTEFKSIYPSVPMSSQLASTFKYIGSLTMNSWQLNSYQSNFVDLDRLDCVRVDNSLQTLYWLAWLDNQIQDIFQILSFARVVLIWTDNPILTIIANEVHTIFNNIWIYLKPNF